MGTGFDGKSLVNTWDFILMLEGAVCFSASVVRRAAVPAPPQAAAPFAVRSRAIGYGSAAMADESARGEQWMPLWQHPATYTELAAVFSEGRSQLKGQRAVRPLEFARAIARLGVARGITAFQRFGYIERNGQANLATPIGRWQVSAQPHQDLLDEIAPWVNALDRAANGKNAPTSIGRTARNCQDAMMACCKDATHSQHWRTLIIALGEAEQQIVRSPAFSKERGLRPIPPLTTGWLTALDVANDPELRLALSMASQYGLTDQGKLDWQNPIRRHFIPYDSPTRFAATSERLSIDDPDIVAPGKTFHEASIAILRRRMIEPGHALMPLCPVSGTEATLADIQAFLSGKIDTGQVLSYAQPLMALRWKGARQAIPHPAADVGALALFSLFRLVHQPLPLPMAGQDAIDVPPDPSILARLASGDLNTAAQTAKRRLFARGIRCHLRQVVGQPQLARLLAAAMIFPVRQYDIVRIIKRLTKPTLTTATSINQQELS